MANSKLTKVSLNSHKLKNAISKLSTIVGNNPILPILECILFETRNGELVLTATNIETTISCTLGNIDKDVSFAIDAKKLKGISPFLSGLAEIEISEDLEKVTINNKYKLPCSSGKDFPETPKTKIKSWQSLEMYDLTGIKDNINATSKDELRLAMTGVYLSEDRIAMTDAHIVYTRECKYKITAPVVIPSNLFKKLDKSKTEFIIDKQNAFFKQGNFNYVCRLIDAKYPDVKAVIPTDKDLSVEVTIDKKHFLDKIHQAGVFANKTTHQIILDIKKSGSTISSADLDFEIEYSDSIDAISNKPIKISFNHKLLSSVITKISNDFITLLIKNERTAVIMKDGQTTHLIMPVQLRPE